MCSEPFVFLIFLLVAYICRKKGLDYFLSGCDPLTAVATFYLVITVMIFIVAVINDNLCRFGSDECCSKTVCPNGICPENE
jgi:hypothetical protein